MSCDMHEEDPPPGAGTGALNVYAHRLLTMGAMPWSGSSVDDGCVAW